MKVKAVVSFVGWSPDGQKHRISNGEEFELPAGVDWREKGLVVSVEPAIGKPKRRRKKVRDDS